MRKRVIMAVLAISLAGCEKTEVRVCENYIKKGLQSPATYKRAEVKSYDEDQGSLDAFRASVGLSPVANADQLGKLEAQLNAGRKISKRQLYITYDADNAFGTPIRGIGACVFKLTDGELEPEERLQSHADTAVLDSQMRELADRGAIARSAAKASPPTGAECCISRH